jgi:TRAP-type C4-dicarboxylate transport system permease small subunit
MTEFAMGLMVYLAVGLTTHANEHISVDVVTLRLSPRMRAVMSLLMNAIAFVFLVLVVWRLWLQAGLLYAKGDVTQVWRVPIWPVAYAMFLGSLFLLTGVLVQMAEAYKQLIGQAAPPVPEPGAPRPTAE